MALVTLRSYTNPIDAHLARLRLEGHGIESLLLDEDLAAIYWLYSDAIGGVKVVVPEEDLEAAREALRPVSPAELAGIPESAGTPAEGDVCPVCGATIVRPSRVRRTAAALSLATALPLVAWRRRWICEACGHSWKPARAASIVPEETRLAEESVRERRSFPSMRLLLPALAGLAILYYVQVRIRGG